MYFRLTPLYACPVFFMCISAAMHTSQTSETGNKTENLTTVSPTGTDLWGHTKVSLVSTKTQGFRSLSVETRFQDDKLKVPVT